MGDINVKAESKASNGVSLKELIIIVTALIRYLSRKWLVILIVGLLGAGIALCYSLFKRTNYTATLSFVMDESGASQGGLGAAATIAEQFGFNLGGMGSVGGFFQGDNIIEFLKSRSMVDKTLLTTVVMDGEPMLLVDRYVTSNKLREKWASNDPELARLRFVDTVG